MFDNDVQNEVLQEMSGMDFQITSKIHTEGEGLIRRVKLSQGKETAFADIPASGFTSLKDFNTYILEHGDFFFMGDAKEFKIKLVTELRRNVPTIYIYRKQGQILPYLWIYPKILFYYGEIHTPSKDGVFWVGSGKNKVGYMIEQLRKSDGDSQVAFQKKHTADTGKMLADIVQMSISNLGGFNGLIGLAWAHATLYASEIHEEFHEFPLLFLVGKTQSGKNVLGRILSHTLGYNWRDGESITSTMVGIERRLAYYSNTPYWLDEYRGGEKKVQHYDSLLRSVYARGAISKGTRNSFGLRTSEIKASLMITGESLPLDQALRSRFVIVQLKRESRNDDVYEDIEKLMPSLWNVGQDWIEAKTASTDLLQTHYIEQVKKSNRYLRGSLSELDNVNRISFCYSVILASAAIILKQAGLLEEYGKSFSDQLLSHIRIEHAERAETSLVGEWWDDFLNLRSYNGDQGIRSKSDYDVSGQFLYIAFNLVNNKIVKYKKSLGVDSTITKGDIKKYILEELDINSDDAYTQRWMGSVNKRVIKIPLQSLPSYVRNTFVDDDDNDDNSDQVNDIFA